MTLSSIQKPRYLYEVILEQRLTLFLTSSGFFRGSFLEIYLLNSIPAPPPRGTISRVADALQPSSMLSPVQQNPAGYWFQVNGWGERPAGAPIRG